MRIVVPALNPTDGNRVDAHTLISYARRAADTWVDAFLLSGSTTRGDLLTPDERNRVIDLWLSIVPAKRLVACCWESSDVANATSRNVHPMLVMRDLDNTSAAIDAFANLPSPGYIYSHPMYTRTVFNVDLANAARSAGVLPAGGKIAKIGGSAEIANLRAATGKEFALWDGSSRHIRQSVEAGASGVIATPLSHFPHPFPKREGETLQGFINESQAKLDALPTRKERTEYLLSAAFSS